MYPGGLRVENYEHLMARNPSLAVEIAVKGMLPHNRLGRAMFKKLKVYDGPEHPHGSQNPQELPLGATGNGNGKG
jgi:large subunit ribosomal protein L13